jgi:peptidoglycan/LPS O-acetylase OafA/YrhL
MKEYFSRPPFYQFISSCILFRIHYNLPGVFEKSIMGAAVNSSLWSVSLELKLYLGLMIVWLLKIPGKIILLISLLFLLIIPGYFFHEQLAELLGKFVGKNFNFYIYTTFCPLFLIGTLCTIYKHKIIIKNYWIFLIVPAALFSLYFEFYPLASFILLPAFILYLATRQSTLIKRIVPKADLSYGIYVFAYPVQQLVVNYLNPQKPFVIFVLTLIFVLPLAVMSWYLIERKALQLKYAK